MLYPTTNACRTVIKLDGLWQMSIIKDDYVPTMPLQSSQWMAVPASYQELVTDKETKNHVGCLCYERTVEIPFAMKKDVIHLRIGAAPHQSRVYIDGQFIGDHQGGFLPHDVIIPAHLTSSSVARLSIIIDNRATFQTLPIGEVVNHQGQSEQLTYFDFANHSGLHRSVLLYSKPHQGIDDIMITTEVNDTHAVVHYQVIGKEQPEVYLKDPSGQVIAREQGMIGQFMVNHPLLWDVGQGNLYTLKVMTAHDLYEESFGIRTINIKDGQLMLNGKSVYLKGFGMHEDHPIIGKGHSTAHALRDFNMLKWINANSFRTSHYPYDEEIYHLADLYGILIIDEVPAVGLNFWSGRPVFVEGTVDEQTLKVHQMQISELIQRDKNHPSVIMYSVANEANTHEKGAVPYFTEVFKHIRTLTTLPIMIVEWVGADVNLVCQMADVIGLNRYIGWYTDLENLQVIPEKLSKDLTLYHTKFHKPIMLTEFGADTIAGLHTLPASVFSEEYQLEFIQTYVKTLKALPFVIGEHVWNFADFMTKPGLTRIHGNKKGVFTRDRQPKMVAHWLKDYWKPTR